MSLQTFKKSVLAAGVVAALGLTGTAMAASQTAADANSKIDNIANATYKVDGVAQDAVVSNSVTVNITEKAAFSLVANNTLDGTPGDDYNEKEAVVPNGFVQFTHRLTNSGNVQDTYTMGLVQNGTTPSSAADTKDYDLANSTVTYVITDKAGGKTTKTVTGTEFNTLPIVLKPGEYADITINAKAIANVGGDTQNLTLSATSTYFTNDGVPNNEKLTNVDNSTTKLPVFQIIKSVSDTLNLNDPSDTATYTIKVKNDGTATYAADAVDAIIKDSLPEGLKLSGTPTAVGGSGANTVTVDTSGAGAGNAPDGFVVSKVNLKVGETITITFLVQKDATETLAKNTINHASVEDDLDNDPNTNNTVIDSTDPKSPTENTGQFYPPTDDTEVTDGSTPTTPGGDSTAPLVSNERALNLTQPTTKEIPSTSTNTTKAVHSTIITNSGKEIEGDTPGELTFKITDGGSNANVSPKGGAVELVYDDDNNPATPNVTVSLSPDANGVYDINTAIPGGMKPGSTITINYDVVSTNAVPGTSETTVVTLIPGGTDAPTTGNFVVTDTTNVKGLTLLKEQALDEKCDGTVVSAFTSNAIAALPGQCVVYRITATNGFGALNMTDVLIYDTTARFTGKATYRADGSITVSSGSTASNPVVNNADNATTKGDAIYTTVNTLAPNGTAVLKFSVKLNATGTTPGTP
ncbi:MAG: hypothetical protein Q4P13_03690 [Psychrobacter sp.]|nr:hypothetical protein [Psychrobacter sp.]